MKFRHGLSFCENTAVAPHVAAPVGAKCVVQSNNNMVSRFRVFGLGFATAAVCAGFAQTAQAQEVSEIACGEHYTVAAKDTLSDISIRAYGAYLFERIHDANRDILGDSAHNLSIGQELMIPCRPASETGDVLALTFNKAAAPDFILNTAVIDAYLADITQATEGRVVFVEPETPGTDYAAQYDLVASGAIDGAYVLNSEIADSHPLLQIADAPMMGGGAAQTATALWQLYDAYLQDDAGLNDVRMMGFVAAPAAQIWRHAQRPVRAEENVAAKNSFATPYFAGLDSTDATLVQAVVAAMAAPTDNLFEEAATMFASHDVAQTTGLWTNGAPMAVTEVKGGTYTPTFSVMLSDAAWAQISKQDQAAIEALSGAALAERAAAWDAQAQETRAAMIAGGLHVAQASDSITQALWVSAMGDLHAWMEAASAADLPATEAVNFYLDTLRSLEPAGTQLASLN